MDSSVHAHLMSQYVKDRIEQADAARAVRTAKRNGVRAPRLHRLSLPRRRPATAAG
jgi:hypothetical protein